MSQRNYSKGPTRSASQSGQTIEKIHGSPNVPGSLRVNYGRGDAYNRAASHTFYQRIRLQSTMKRKNVEVQRLRLAVLRGEVKAPQEAGT